MPAATNVLCMCDRLQVRDLTAGRLAAEMIKLEPLGDRPVLSLPFDHVHVTSPAVDPTLAISKVILPSLPDAAGSLVATIL